MSAVKVRALMGKEWDPLSWVGDVWKDPNGVEDIDPSDSDELFHLRT